MPPRAKTKLPPPSTAHSSADAQPGLQQGAQRTRDRILQAARELVLEEGASRLTLDAVVVRAGLSKGAFLYHFKTKRDLFVTLTLGLIPLLYEVLFGIKRIGPWNLSVATAHGDRS